MNEQGRMFIPMNVEGGGYDENFFSTPKLITAGLLVLVLVILIATLASPENRLSALGKVLAVVFYLFIASFVVRYVIFEERYYFKMYKKMLANQNPTTAVFWRIAAIRDTVRGGILRYSDGKYGAILKLERDSIIGKNSEFRESHFDALSDFYKELALRKLAFVQLNMMERADNDSRIPALDTLILNEPNANLKKVLQLELGYIKNRSRETLYETDYILVYTTKLERVDSLISDLQACASILLDGAYSGFEILGQREIIDLHKEIFGIGYFNLSEASINTFNEVGAKKKAITLKALKLTNGRTVELTKRDTDIINRLLKRVEDGEVDISDISVLKALGDNRFVSTTAERGSWGLHGLDIDLSEEQDNDTSEEEREVLEKPAESEEKVREEKGKTVSIEEEVKIAVAEKIRANAAWTRDSGKREDRSLSGRAEADRDAGKPVSKDKPEVRDTTKPVSNEKAEVRDSGKSVQSDKTEGSKEYVASLVFNEDVDWDKEIDF
jgi:hypothetical protein